MIGSGRLHNSGFGCCIEVGRVKIIFPGKAGEREQRVASGIGECRSHSLRRGYIGDRTHGPFGGDPFARRMSKDSCEAKKASIFVDCGGLDCRDLISAKALADNVETARQRGVAEGAVSFTVEGGSDFRKKRLLWIGQVRLRLGKCCRYVDDGFTGPVHGCPPRSRHQSSPHRIWIVWLECHGRSLPWRPRASEP